MEKIKNPQSISEWMTELWRVAHIGVGANGMYVSKARAREGERALANTRRRFEGWLAAHPEVERPSKEDELLVFELWPGKTEH